MSRQGPRRWTLPALLARLDHEVVPLLQWSARAVAWLVGWPFRTLTRAELRTRLGSRLHRHSSVLAFVAVVIAFLGSAVHLQRYPDLRDEALAADPELPGEGSAADSTRDTSSEVDGPVAVGPVLGSDVDGHVRRAGISLDDLEGGEVRPAVVSYGEYETPESVLASLPEGVEVLSVQYRLPSQEERPQRLETARDGLAAAVQAAVAAAHEAFAEEEDEVQKLLDSDTVEDPAFREDLELRLSELATIRNLLATEAPVVFAVVVRAPAEALRALSEHDAVRLVDVAPSGTDADDAVFYGVLPEDRDRATWGREA